MRLVLDTSAYTALMRGQPEVVRHVRSAERVFLPATVVGELLFGFRGGARFSENQVQLARFLASPYVEFSPTDVAVCERYALVMHRLKRKGRPIPTNDVWIAAHALALGADLLSSDRHFSAVDGLIWREP